MWGGDRRGFRLPEPENTGWGLFGELKQGRNTITVEHCKFLRSLGHGGEHWGSAFLVQIGIGHWGGPPKVGGAWGAKGLTAGTEALSQ